MYDNRSIRINLVSWVGNSWFQVVFSFFIDMSVWAVEIVLTSFKPSTVCPVYGGGQRWPKGEEMGSPCPPNSMPPPSGLHNLLSKLLGDQLHSNTSGTVSLELKFVWIIMNLAAKSDRSFKLMRDMVKSVNSKFKSMAQQIAQLTASQRPSHCHSTIPSYASVTNGNQIPCAHPAPKSSPPTCSFLDGLSPKRVVIHSNPLNTTLKDIPAPALVQKTNETLAAMDAKVDRELVTVRGVAHLPSGDVSFYALNRQHQKWLMDNKHVWTKGVHPDLEASPSTYSVMVHGIPKSFDVTSKVAIACLASKNHFQASEIAWV